MPQNWQPCADVWMEASAAQWKLSNFPPLPNSLEVVVGVAGIVTGENADGSD